MFEVVLNLLWRSHKIIVLSSFIWLCVWRRIYGIFVPLYLLCLRWETQSCENVHSAGFSVWPHDCFHQGNWEPRLNQPGRTENPAGLWVIDQFEIWTYLLSPHFMLVLNGKYSRLVTGFVFAVTAPPCVFRKCSTDWKFPKFPTGLDYPMEVCTAVMYKLCKSGGS